ncbi:MAG: threonine aldolase family protein [Woeseiaceae bacterium]
MRTSTPPDGSLGVVSSPKYFISDNAAGVHPEVMAALVAANRGHAVAYGHDSYTEQATALLREHFGGKPEILFVLTGTGANVLALQCLLHSYEAVICADCSHLNRDECGAPEKFIGAKLLPTATRQGKLFPDLIAPLLLDAGMVHRAQPKVVTVSQCTEWGTVYTVDELRDLADFCHANDLRLHVDGARLSNAAVALDVELGAMTSECDVDVLSFGGTKNGLMGAEAVLVFDSSLLPAAGFYRKQAMQLSSKMRFIAVQFQALLSNELWRRNARHANAMAARLAEAVSGIDAVQLVMPVETNAVFARLPPADIAELQDTEVFAMWDSRQSVVRWMTAFDTTEEEVDSFAERISRVGRGKDRVLFT